MKITKREFIELTGEDPVDILGNDWENEAQEYLEDNEFARRAEIDAERAKEN